MQVTDEMVRVAVQAMKALEDKATEDPENIFGADLTSLARAALTAALAAMWQPVTGDMEPNRNYLLGWHDWRDHSWCCEVAPAITGLRYENGYSSISHHGSATHYAPLPPAPSQLSKRGDAERDSIQEA